MKLVNTRLRNKMKDDFLASYMITYIENDIAHTFTIDEFDTMK